MALSAKGLADKVSAIQQTHARALRADLLRLETRYGTRAVTEAMAFAKQRELRATLSIGGQRQRQHARGEDAREAAEAVFRKPEPEGK